jgi:hypothetical protein
MNRLFLFSGAVKRDSAIDKFMDEHSSELGVIANHWFEFMRESGDDVRELMHDGYPTACVDDAAFAYVGVFKAHVNVGFFGGAGIADPAGLLEGTGKYMRHVKIRPEKGIDAKALKELIEMAYADMRRCLDSGLS